MLFEMRCAEEFWRAGIHCGAKIRGRELFVARVADETRRMIYAIARHHLLGLRKQFCRISRTGRQYLQRDFEA